jgi:hypothetical protein
MVRFVEGIRVNRTALGYRSPRQFRALQPQLVA